ncbi:MAG TPA: enoyl-CoA hydratase/isomerase family protein [Blastocatellia bacterium]|nr:enoyl-CoA hydratase/isomerase family protein [Blastocatellia bacterium]
MLLTERQDKILLLTLNRPDKRNALHPELVLELFTTLEAAAYDDTLQVVIITGAGKAFCAGLDLEHTLGKTQQQGSKFGIVFDVFHRIYTLPQPVIAAISGPAIAGGFDLAQFCDLRLCAPNAVFSQAEINLGLTQMMYPLYQSIGIARAKELALTGAVIDAEEAYRIGFVNHIYPSEDLMNEAMKLAQLLASKPREALFATKRLSRELLELNYDAAIERQLSAIRERLQSDEHRNTLAAYKAQLKQK